MNILPRRRRGRRLGLTTLLATCTLVLTSLVSLATPAQAADESIAVDFSVSSGSPTYRASGWIYGMAENASGPADHFFRDVNFRYMRAGGAQLD
ncbi:beta-xylosidase, partial [Streptomyces sp. 8K308]